MDTVHSLLAYAAAVGAVVGISWSAILWITRRAGGPAFESFQAGVVAMLIVSAASGLVRLASGARPAESLHLLYAVIAIALVPIARSFLGRASGRRAAGLLLVAFVVLGAVVYRLFTTG